MILNTKAETILWCNVYAAKINTTTPAKAAGQADNAVNELRKRMNA